MMELVESFRRSPPPVTAALALLALLAAGPAPACSICRCGDPTFNALGSEGAAQTGLRVAFDVDQVRKTQGSSDGEFEALKERRYSLLLAYGLSERVGLFVRVPYSVRDLDATEEGETTHVHSSGLADPEIYGQVRLWSAPFSGDVGVRSSLFAVVGVKTALGDSELSRSGERLDEHVQPGTGSTDWFGGLSGSYHIDRDSTLFLSAQYRSTGRNAAGYRYGNAVLANVAFEHKLSARWDGVFEANYRHAGRDELDRSGALDGDTGGSMLYLTPRLLFDLGGGWVVRAAAQLPVAQSGLNGAQREKTVFNLGITYLVGH
jgi:hypothetical protein